MEKYCVKAPGHTTPLGSYFTLDCCFPTHQVSPCPWDFQFKPKPTPAARTGPRASLHGLSSWIERSCPRKTAAEGSSELDPAGFGLQIGFPFAQELSKGLSISELGCGETGAMDTGMDWNQSKMNSNRSLLAEFTQAVSIGVKPQAHFPGTQSQNHQKEPSKVI